MLALFLRQKVWGRVIEQPDVVYLPKVNVCVTEFCVGIGLTLCMTWSENFFPYACLLLRQRKALKPYTTKFCPLTQTFTFWQTAPLLNFLSPLPNDLYLFRLLPFRLIQFCHGSRRNRSRRNGSRGVDETGSYLPNENKATKCIQHMMSSFYLDFGHVLNR